MLLAMIGGLVLAPFLVKGILGYEKTTLSFKTHTHKFDNFMFEYPSDWFINEGQGPGAVVTISNFNPSKLPSKLTFDTNKSATSSTDFTFTEEQQSGSTFDTNKVAIDILALNNPRSLNLEQFIAWHDKNNYEGTGIPTIVHSVTPIVVNGKRGVLREITTLTTVWEVILEGTDKLHLLTARKDPKFEETFNQIVHSFQIDKRN